MRLVRSLLAVAIGAAALGACGKTHEGLASLTPCDNPTERIAGSGIIQCESGLVHRAAAGTCHYVPSGETLTASTLPDQDECIAATQCNAKPHGYCVPGRAPYGGTRTPNTCAYACTVDADCSDGAVCVCGELHGECHPANCATDADCGHDTYCSEYSERCSAPSGFACQATTDGCLLDTDCGYLEACALDSYGNRYCVMPFCGG